MHPPVRELLETARAAAGAAAEVHLRWAGRTGSADAREKGTSDFVSQVDLDAQEEALAVIRERHPGHTILAEEDEADTRRHEGSALAPDSPVWVVDPLDGTTNFLHGHPCYAASVGVVVAGRPVAGAVRAAATEEEWWAAAGEGAFHNGEPIRVSRVGELRGALVGTGFPFKILHALPSYLPELGRVLGATSGIRRGGSAALDLCYLAQGRLDAFWEGWLAPWDVAAGLAILAEAGGVWSRMDGTPLDPVRDGSVLAANSPALLEALGAVVRGGAEGGEAVPGGSE